MSKKPVSQKRAQRQQQERAALNNIFNTFLAGLAAECYLFIVYRGYIAGNIDSLLAWDNILRVLMWLGAAALVAGGVFTFLKRGEDKLRKLGLGIASSGLFFFVSSFVMTRFFDLGVIGMCATVPVLTVLALIFFLYPRDFINTLLIAVSIFTVWACDRGTGGIIRIGAILVAVLLAVFGVAARRTQFNDGKFGKWQIFPAECDYRMVYIVSIVCILLVALAIIVPALAYYLIWAAVVALFAELAFYTTKMM